MATGDTTYEAPSLKAGAIDSQFPMPFFAIDWGSAVTVSISGTSAQSSALSRGAYFLVSTTDVHLNEASNPTATTSDGLLPANQMIPHMVATEDDKIAGIQSSAAGTLFIIPIKAA